MLDLVIVGRIQKPYGIQGFTNFFVEEQYFDDILNTNIIFVEQNGALIPFFIEKISTTPSLIKFEDINTPEEALLVSSRQIYLRATDIQIKKADDNQSKLIGYTLEDITLGTIGMIQELIEMPQQQMAIVNYHDKEVFIPINDQLVIKTKQQEAKIIMDLPEGLLNL